MGRDGKRIVITGSVSRHFSQEDKDDDGDWEELRGRIQQICRERRYSNLFLDVN